MGFAKFSKKIAIINILVLLTIALIFTHVISRKYPCGYRSNLFPDEKSTCLCAGLIEEIPSLYRVDDVCTGINLSNNDIKDFIVTAGSQKQSEKKELFKLTVSVVELTLNTPVTKGRVVASNKANEEVQAVQVDEYGKALLKLPEGEYVINMAGGYTGYKKVILTDQSKQELLNVVKMDGI